MRRAERRHSGDRRSEYAGRLGPSQLTLLCSLSRFVAGSPRSSSSDRLQLCTSEIILHQPACSRSTLFRQALRRIKISWPDADYQTPDSVVNGDIMTSIPGCIMWGKHEHDSPDKDRLHHRACQ
jgi:hypothetical protein